jgi:hypothetical protein
VPTDDDHPHGRPGCPNTPPTRQNDDGDTLGSPITAATVAGMTGPGPLTTRGHIDLARVASALCRR